MSILLDKTFYAAVLCVLSINVSATEPVLDSNPFLENDSIQEQNNKIFSFSDSKHFLPSDTDYINQAQETKQHGFALVNETQMVDINNIINEYQHGHAIFQLTLKPDIMSLQSTEDQAFLANQFAGSTQGLDSFLLAHEFTVLSKTVAGNFVPGLGWDQLTQVVSSDTFGKMIISVFYFSKGSGVYIDADAVNYYVNNQPGILLVLKDNNNKEYSSLAWADNKQSYQIQLAKNVHEVALAKQFDTLKAAMSLY